MVFGLLWEWVLNIVVFDENLVGFEGLWDIYVWMWMLCMLKVLMGIDFGVLLLMFWVFWEV